MYTLHLRCERERVRVKRQVTQMRSDTSRPCTRTTEVYDNILCLPGTLSARWRNDASTSDMLERMGSNTILIYTRVRCRRRSFPADTGVALDAGHASAHKHSHAVCTLDHACHKTECNNHKTASSLIHALCMWVYGVRWWGGVVHV